MVPGYKFLMGCNRLVSRDWAGVMKDRIESQFNAPVLFLNGAIGDVGPRTNKLYAGGFSAGQGDGIESIREVGYRAATDAMRALISIKEWRNDLKLNVLVDDIFIPYAPLEPLEKAEAAKAEWEARKDEFGTPMCEYMHACSVIEAHKKALIRIGATKVVLPERDMGERIASTVISSDENIIEHILLPGDASIIEFIPPAEFIGKTLRDIDMRAKYGVNVIAIKKREENKETGEVTGSARINITPLADDIVAEDDVLVVFGENKKIEKLKGPQK